MTDRQGNKKKLKRMKQPLAYEGAGVKLSNSVNAPVIDYPVFSFKHVLKGYAVKDCNKQEKCDLVSKLDTMSQKTWAELMRDPSSTGAGFETIGKKQFKGSLPGIVSEDVGSLYSIRFNGQSSRLIGHKSGHIFHITHIDVKLGAYSH